MKTLITSLCIALSLTSAVSAETLYGPVTKVVDGDTLWISGEKVRLHGIDAFESTQTCGTGAATWYCGAGATALLSTLTSNETTCDVVDVDKYGRKVAKCYTGGIDVNAGMVKMGYALAYTYFSKDYVASENYAKANQLGAHATGYVDPYIFRKNK